MFKQFFLKRRVKKFIVTMSQPLAFNYGQSAEYTVGQVKTTLKTLGYSAEYEEVAIGIFCNAEVARAYGMDEALVKKYRGYPREHNIGIGTDGVSGFGGDAGGGGGGGD